MAMSLLTVASMLKANFENTKKAKSRVYFIMDLFYQKPSFSGEGAKNDYKYGSEIR